MTPPAPISKRAKKRNGEKEKRKRDERRIAKERKKNVENDEAYTREISVELENVAQNEKKGKKTYARTRENQARMRGDRADGNGVGSESWWSELLIL